jgi:hypothetical protein
MSSGEGDKCEVYGTITRAREIKRVDFATGPKGMSLKMKPCPKCIGGMEKALDDLNEQQSGDQTPSAPLARGPQVKTCCSSALSWLPLSQVAEHRPDDLPTDVKQSFHAMIERGRVQG